MKREIKKSNLVPICEQGFESLKLSERRKKCLLTSINKLVSYMGKNNLDIYSESIGKEFIAHLPMQSSQMQRINSRAIYLLESFIEGRKYELKPSGKIYVFPGDIGAYSQHFIKEEEVLKRLSHKTVKTYTATLNRFSIAMEIRQVTLQNLSRQDIEIFISSVQNMNAHIFIPLRKFLRYLYDTKITEQDFSILLQHLKRTYGSKLPSVYTPEEIIKLETSIQRGSAIGKRNYAMLLLASRLGLRASDIVNLEFSNIDWPNKSIRLFQLKTGHPIELPLLSDVGDAIIDYILYGRPKTEIKKIFVTATNPVRTLVADNVRIIVTRMISEAGIEVNGRHHGGHAMRHSLATNILGNNVGLSVISNVLGHVSTKTTMVYLGVDVKILIEYSMEVPFVDKDFYEQKGGCFYV
ncbi:Tyrosine recombinase XerD [termite gut metagenome]|uniref:Tyrosine recombinase XerD n=1 Tax=termite gut metagenome TaxID=433724 RepID=A0A5J4QW51_9ZZZZ